MTVAVEPPLLRAQNVCVRFGKLRAVEDVSFSLRGGDFLGLLGANGAGKTTLMRAVCGLQSIRYGDVYLMGEPLTDRSQQMLRHIGFTPDTPPVYDALTVRQFLRFVGRQYQLDARDTDERIDFWLDKLWLTDKADGKIKGLSRGMKQRIGIARTLLANPALVVLDEPAAGLDPAGRVQFRNLLGDLRRQGKAVIVSSHVLSDLADQCTHIGLMTGGRLTRFESVESFVGVPADTSCRYRVTLAQSLPDAASLAGGVDGVTDAAARGAELTFVAPRGPDAAHGVLVGLLAAGLRVSAFAPVPTNLEEAYLRASGGPADA